MYVVTQRNGLFLRQNKPVLLTISETAVNRDVSEILSGGRARTYAFPRTVAEVHPRAFDALKTLQSVRPNEGLKTIGEYAFARSGLRFFTAPASLKRIEKSAFSGCKNLKRADFGASALRPEDGYKYFSQGVFEESGLESVVLPRALRVIEKGLFSGTLGLKSVYFGENSQLEEIRASAFKKCGLESFIAPASLK